LTWKTVGKKNYKIMSNKKIILLDLDGVLAMFVKSAMSALNITDYSVPRGVHPIEKWNGVNVTTEQFWKAIDNGGESFWENLEKYPWADDLLNYCERKGSTFFLTAPSRNPNCSSGKMKWIKKHYPHMTRRTILTAHKYLLAAPERLLIDDTEDKVDSFTQWGGNGLLFPQLWNRDVDYYNEDGKHITYVKEMIDEHFKK
jgi:5'(3')-deoxyribonucleotidase